jgi:DNA-binding HxlR family transcriptional regulator
MPKAPSKDSSARPIRNCSVERALSVIADAWTFLVLREIYFGARRFEQIQKALQISRTTLTDRLASLVESKVLRRMPVGDGSRTEYRMAERGLDLYSVMLALLRFGDDWLTDDAGRPLTLTHDACGHECHPETVCSACNGAVDALHVTYRDGPGAGTGANTAPRRRRIPDSKVTSTRRPDSVARTLSILADRWTFLVIREAFFGVRRFDGFHEKLGIAPNILADRLNRLVDQRVFKKVTYQTQPARFEYQLTETGRALYLPLIQMLRWGDTWAGLPPPLLLTHSVCGQDFTPIIACDHCRAPLKASEMSYTFNYALD